MYNDIWSCNGCDFSEETEDTPISINPEDGILKAKIEKRWCKKCNGIRRVFTGMHEDYWPGDEPNSYFSYYCKDRVINLYKDRSELFKKKSNLFFRFSKDKKKLTQLEKEIFEHEKSVAICLNLSEKSFKYYSKHKPPAKCLICNSIDVSKLPYYYDKHSCGGDFNVNIKRMGQAIFYTNITYSADGSSVVEKKPFNF